MIDRRGLLSSVAYVAMLPLQKSVLANGLHSADHDKPCIFVNQIGYLPDWPKFAVLQQFPADSVVNIIDAVTKKRCGRAQILPMANGDTGADLRCADFSSLKRPGKYHLAVGKITSARFAIGSDVYASLFRQLMRSYYLQRCGVALSDKETGLTHGPCHLKDGTLARADAISPQAQDIPSCGGWHDAGDFGKYVATTAVTVGEILSVYEQHPKLFRDGQLDIPESGNGQPDILDEMSVGIDWMMSMQRADGAVYRKVSGAAWPKAMPPDTDLQPRFVYGISTPETAKFCAAMAVAARVYVRFDEGRAVRFLEAAMSAWNYLERQQEFVFDCEPSDNTGSGSYMANQVDREATLLSDIDDRAWAGAELFLATGQTHFLDAVNKQVALGDYGLFEWKNPSPLGFQNILNSGKGPTELVSQLREMLAARATRLSDDARISPWGLSNRRMIWGSNKIAAANGSCLLTAGRHFKSSAYRAAAIRQLDYILGVNPAGKCFVTAAGSQPVEHVAHLYARAVKMNIPGLLVGGPNNDAQDKIAPGGMGLLSYLDDERSYSTNEYAIDYNAALIGLLGGLLAHQDILH